MLGRTVPPVLQETILYLNTQISLKEKIKIVNYLSNKLSAQS